MAANEPALSTLDELHHAHGRLREEGAYVAAQATQLDAQAEDRFADAGALLVPRREWWRPPPELYPRIAEADRLWARIWSLDQRLGTLDESAGWRRPLTAITRRRRIHAASRLREALTTIGRDGAPSAAEVPEVGPILEEAAELQARARHLRFSLGNTARRLSELEREIGRRQQAEHLMGFDALHAAAHFARHGLPQIDSPYELEAGEAAYLTMGAALARPRPGAPYESPDGGAVPPPEYTGIPHWMGAFRNGPAPVDPTGEEPGTLLLTSHRLAFAGAAESAAIWLDSAVDMDVYQDAIAVRHMTAPGPLILRVPAPRQVAFYINWAMRQPAVEER